MPIYTVDNIVLGIIAEGRRSRSGEGQRDHPLISEKGIKIALATGLVETNLQMYANRADPESLNFPHDKIGSDSKSSGVFQQQPPWWGTVADRMDVARSAALFYNSLYRQRFNNQDYNTEARTPGQWAQMVQRSSFPDRYDERYPDAERIYRNLSGAQGPLVPSSPAPLPDTYGVPRGSNSGGYGGTGVRFPDWVYQLGNAFGLKPSTYPGHQESERNEAGYAPNPQRLNRGIDWAAPGDPAEIDKLTKFADYLATIPQHLEQVIWQNPRTMRSVEVAGGRPQPGYFSSDLAGHRDHVHTRQSKPIPIPGGAPALAPLKPQFTEIAMFGWGHSSRSRPPINFLLHTQEGSWDASAKDLAEFCQGQNNVSYHYTIRNGIVYDVVDTDRYSWSVLSANVFTINLCFAGSSVTQTRQQWLDRYARDIDIAAYLAVQDARKYNFSTEVIVPPYAGAARPGLSDHKYVTEKLRIGNHTDVGNNFPWDVFTQSVRKYADGVVGGDPVLELLAMPNNQEKLDFIFNELSKKGPSRSLYRSSNDPIESQLGFVYNIDAMSYDDRVEASARQGEAWAIKAVAAVAGGNAPGSYHWWDTTKRNQDAIDHARAVLESIDNAVLTEFQRSGS